MNEIKFNDEKQLHFLIKANIDSLENGLIVLQHLFRAKNNTEIDLLCLDGEGRIVIIEVKINEDRKQLYQALKYCIEIRKCIGYFPKIFDIKNIKFEESPRIILIAKEFSEIMRNTSLLVKPKIDFFKYQAYQNQTINFEKMESPILETYYPLLYSIEKHLERIQIKDIKDHCIDSIRIVEDIDSSLRVYAIKDKINIQHLKSQRIISYIETHQKSYRIFAYKFVKRHGNYCRYSTKNVSVKKKNQDLNQIFEQIKCSIESLNIRDNIQFL